MTTETDREILEGFVKGHAGTTAIVVSWVREVVRHSTWGNESAAEDLVSDTVIKLLRLLGSGQFRGESALKTYVCRVARYTAVDFLRHERRAKLLLTEANVRPEPVPTPEELYAVKERRLWFDRILSLVDPRCKRLWEMIFAEHLSYTDIAAREGLSPSAIKVRAFRCKEEAVALRERMRIRIPGRGSNDSKAGGKEP